MVDELRYAGRYGSELLAGLALGYVITSKEHGSNISFEETREEYPLNADSDYNIFALMSEYSSKENEYYKIFSSLIMSSVVLEGIDQAPEYADYDVFDGTDVFVGSFGLYLGMTAKQADWDDVRKALS